MDASHTVSSFPHLILFFLFGSDEGLARLEASAWKSGTGADEGRVRKKESAATRVGVAQMRWSATTGSSSGGGGGRKGGGWKGRFGRRGGGRRPSRPGEDGAGATLSFSSLI